MYLCGTGVGMYDIQRKNAKLRLEGEIKSATVGMSHANWDVAPKCSLAKRVELVQFNVSLGSVINRTSGIHIVSGGLGLMIKSTCLDLQVKLLATSLKVGGNHDDLVWGG